MRHAKDGGLRDGRMFAQGIFGFDRIDVFPARDDHFLGAPRDGQIAVCVHHASITRVEKSAAHGMRRLIRAVPVAIHHLWSAHHDFTGRSGWHRIVVSVHNPQIGIQNRAAHSAEFIQHWIARHVIRRFKNRQDGRRFGQPVTLTKGDARNGGNRAFHQRDGHRGRAICQHTDGREIKIRKARMVHHHVQHRGHHGHGRDPLRFDHAQGVLDLEFRLNDHCGTIGQCCEHTTARAKMEQRPRQQQHVILPVAI